MDDKNTILTHDLSLIFALFVDNTSAKRNQLYYNEIAGKKNEYKISPQVDGH